MISLPISSRNQRARRTAARACAAIMCFGPSTLVAQDLLLGTPFAGAAVVEVGRGAALGVVLDVKATRDGSLLIVDRAGPRTIRLDSTGAIVATYGRVGGGPGELRFPYRVVERSDGAVLVYDFSSRRFSEFTRSGQFVRQWLPSVPLASVDQVIALDERRIAVCGIVSDPRATQNAVHIFGPTLVRERSVGDAPAAQSAAREILGAGGLTAMADGAMLFTRRIPYQLKWYSAAGTLDRQLTVALPVSASPDDLYRIRKDPSGGESLEASPTAIYPLAAYQLPDGRIFGGRVVSGQRVWDLLSGTGKVAWSGPAPKLMGYPVSVDFARKSVWMLGETEDGEPVLRMVRLAGNPRTRGER